MPLKIRIRAIAFGCLSALSTGRPSLAQSTVAPDNRQRFETRAQLEGQLKEAQAKQNSSAAYRIQYRLDNGDFVDGDRIFVSVQQGAAGFADTLVVRGGKRLDLPQMGDLSLQGTLRSELVPRLTEHLSKFLRDPLVKAVPFVRLGILGSVGRPGFYYLPADLPLTDVLMRAGGPGGDADLDKIIVRRLGDVVIDESNTRIALSEGMSPDMLHLQGGDEVSVGRQSHPNWGLYFSIASSVVGLLIAYGVQHR